jgi:hypothetical protein
VGPVCEICGAPRDNLVDYCDDCATREERKWRVFVKGVLAALLLGTVIAAWFLRGGR